MFTTHRLRPAALAALVLAGSAGGALIAGGAASASSPQPVSPTAAGGGSVVTGAVAAIDRLVADDVLTGAQGDAIDQQIRSGSIDPKQLVNSGVVSDAQMRAAAAAIAQVKRAGG
jgi:hypothetical protein